MYDVDEGIEGESYEFSINNQPSWISFDSETGELSGTPDNEDVGTYTGIEIRVNDGEVEVSLSSYGITVTNLNDGPTIEAIADQSMEEDSTISVEIEVEDIDSEITTENLSFSSGDTSILSLSGYEFVITSSVILSPESNQYGEVEIEISVSDGVESESSSFTLTVSNVNDEPSISEIIDVSTQEDESVVVTFNIGDIDNELTTENLSFESGNIYVVEASGYEFISTSSVEISPKSNQSGTVEIMIEVEDGESSVSTEFTLTVETVNDDPEVEE